MTKVLLSTYYLILTFIIYRKGSSVLYKNFSSDTNFVWLSRIFSGAPISNWLVLIIFLTALFFSTLCIFKHKKIYRALVALFLIMVFSLLYSFGKINHSNHIWLISSIFMCFIHRGLDIDSRNNKTVIMLLRTIFLTHYISSGIWKLRNLEDVSFSYLTKIGQEHVSYVIAEGSPSIAIVRESLQKFPDLVGLGLLFVILFQISCVIPILLKKHYAIWGIAALIFHLTTGLVLGIWFSSTVFGILFFLIFTEILSETHSKQLNPVVKF